MSKMGKRETGETNAGSRVTVLLSLALVVATLFSDITSAASTNRRPLIQTSPTASPKKQNTGGRMVVEQAFSNAGRTPGLEIWRIEDFKPVAYPKNEYGKFYTGDSYIILYTKKNKNNQFDWDIHFWLGSETSQDEAGSAAILAVQLDDHLGGTPVQYREVQGHESQLFLSHFKNGVRYLPGGVATGFRHVDADAFEKKLYQVKGSRNVRVTQVTPVISSMNRGDCFILDVGKDVYVYVGVKSKRVERLKAIGAANQIRDQDHAGKSKITIVDEYSPQSDFTEFFSALGSGSADEVPDDTAGGDDAQYETTQERSVALYKISDASGSLKITPVGQKPLEQSLLDTNDCFILETGTNIFVWVGKKCTETEKREAMKKAEGFLTSKNLPKWTNIQRIVDGAETTAFTQYFRTWRGARELNARIVRSASTDSIPAWEPRLFHAQIKYKGGRFLIEEVHNFSQEDLNEDDVMLVDIGKELYVWIGNGADADEKRKSGDMAEKFLKDLGREGTTITTVSQGDEPKEFKNLFPSWNPDLWNSVDTYENLKAKFSG